MKYHNILALGALLLTFEACSLKEEPIDFIGQSNFYKTDNDMLSSLNGAYDAMRSNSYYGKTFTVCLWCSTDFGDGTGGTNTAEQFTSASLTPSHLWLNDMWAGIYDAINRANKTIYYTENNENLTPEMKTRIIGESKFLRALHYFNLVRCFGEVPMRLKPATPDNYSTPLSSIKDIYDQIIDDLKYAELNCWNREETQGKFTNDIGRATKLSAKLLLAKVYLHIASAGRVANTPGFKDGDFTGINEAYSVYTDYKDYYQLCSDKCAEGILHPDFHLESDWASLWDNSNRNAKEFLFSVQASSTPGYGSQLPWLYLPKQSVLGGSLSSNGSNFRITPSFPETQILYGDNMYRLNNGCATRIDFRDGSPSEIWKIDAKGKAKYVLESNNSKEGTGGGKKNALCITKYRDPASTDNSSTACNIPVLRAVDFYLMKAEADAEIGEDPTLAYASLNKSRERLEGVSIIDNAFLNTFTGSDPMEKFRYLIMKERLQEFLGENDRYFTLLRMGKLIEHCNVIGKKFAKKVRDSVDDYYWPLPIDEIQANQYLN